MTAKLIISEVTETILSHSTGIAIGGLDPTFDYLVSVMAPKKVRYSASQYDSFKAMKEDYERTGYLTINVEHSQDTIFGSPQGNWQFRAWHDMCHIQANADFSPQGEHAAARLMVKQLWALNGPSLVDKARWAAIIDEEVNGQGLYYQIHGKFPDNQLQFAFGYLATAYDMHNFPRDVHGVTIEY